MYQIIFKYRRSDSVTGILLVTGLPSFDTVLFSAQHVFSCKWSTCINEIVNNKFRVVLKYRIINFNAVFPSICLSVYWSVCLLVLCSLLYIHILCCVFFCFCLFYMGRVAWNKRIVISLKRTIFKFYSFFYDNRLLFHGRTHHSYKLRPRRHDC